MKKVAAATLPVLALVLLLSLHAKSQSLPLGTMLAEDPIGPCSGVRNGMGFGQNMTCAGMSVSCPNTQALTGIYGWYAPANPKGTIVLFSGGPGTTPSENFDEDTTYANDYEAAGYTVVQMEWDSSWEDPNNGGGGNILTAACRPATFLNWVSTHLVQSGKPMCAQGSSAGSAAIAFPLAWYGAGPSLTNVELLSGPVLSEIDQGCNTTNPLDMHI